MIPVRILGTSSVLAGPRVTTEELAARAVPGRDVADVVARTGIATRHWVDDDASVATLGAEAVRRALAVAGLDASALGRLLLVCSTGGDRLIPATANAVLHELGLDRRCAAFDVNNACMGFLSALDVGARAVATGAGPVAIAVVETLSRFVAPEVPRPYLVLADAAAAVVLGEACCDEGIVGSYAANDGSHYGSVTLGHPGLSGRVERISFADSSGTMTSAAIEALATAARRALDEARLPLERVDWVVPHQPNGAMLDHVVRHLGVDSGKLVRTVHEIGSVGAASIPVGLDRLLRERPVRAGQHVLLLGVGAGMAYGAAVYRA